MKLGWNEEVKQKKFKPKRNPLGLKDMNRRRQSAINDSCWLAQVRTSLGFVHEWCLYEAWFFFSRWKRGGTLHTTFPHIAGSRWRAVKVKEVSYSEENVWIKNFTFVHRPAASVRVSGSKSVDLLRLFEEGNTLSAVVVQRVMIWTLRMYDIYLVNKTVGLIKNCYF